MVKIVEVLQREGEKGPFALLEIQSELEVVQSQKTGNFYGTIRRCTIPCTMDLQTAQNYIGKEIPGVIVRVQCDAYEYKVPGTEDVVSLGYRWGYAPEDGPTVSVNQNQSVSQPI